ncbi:MAG: VanZ family protein [Bacteroidota bacterium]|nr:VanZ family protein [Bacteroidota bacterium]
MIKTYRFAILWALFVLFLCGINGSNLPDLHFDFVLGIDKIAHMFLFGLQAWFILKASYKNHDKSYFVYAVTATVISSLYGILIEVLQGVLFINRTFDYADMLANAMGAFLSIPFGYLLLKKR